MGGYKTLHQWLNDNLKVPAQATSEVWVLLKIGFEGELKKALLIKNDATNLDSSICNQLPRWIPNKVNETALVKIMTFTEDYLDFRNAGVESRYVLKLRFKDGKLQ